MSASTTTVSTTASVLTFSAATLSAWLSTFPLEILAEKHGYILPITLLALGLLAITRCEEVGWFFKHIDKNTHDVVSLAAVSIYTITSITAFILLANYQLAIQSYVWGLSGAAIVAIDYFAYRHFVREIDKKWTAHLLSKQH